MIKIQVNSQGKAYYTSGGKVLLAPESGGEQVEAENLSGANISKGNKVWINSYSYDEGEETQISPSHSTYLHNIAMYSVAADGQSYIVKGNNNSLPKGHYRTSDNTLISNAGFSTNTKIMPNPNDGGSTFVVVAGASQTDSPVYLHSYTGSARFDNTICRVVANAPWLMLKKDSSTSPATYTLAEYNLSSITLVSETPIDVQTDYFPAHVHNYTGVRLNNENILFVMSFNTARLYTYDSELNKWGFTRTVTISGTTSGSYRFGFVTPDGKYMLMGSHLCYLGDVLAGGNITSTDFSIVSATAANYSCIANGNTFKLLVNKTIDNKTYNLVYNYNAETGNFDQVAIDKDNPDTNQFAGCDADMNYQVFIKPYSGSQYDAYLVNTEAITGNFLVSYAPSNITIDTQTGIAAENITAGGTGLVNVASSVS